VALGRPGSPAIENVEKIDLEIEEAELTEALPPCDWIIHLAQSSNYRDFPNSAEDIFNVNTKLAFRLLEFARKTDVKSFTFASTGSIYGGLSEGCKEREFVQPADFYSCSKLAAEVLSKAYISFFPVQNLRLFFPYGPDQTNRLIPSLIDRIREGNPVTLQGDEGGMLFCPTHVVDIAKIIATATEGSWNDTFNVASDELLSMENVAGTIAKELQVELAIVREENKIPPVFSPSIASLREKLPDFNFIAFEQGVKALVA